jgi:MAP/microtubule affinity-regulating kinase
MEIQPRSTGSSFQQGNIRPHKSPEESWVDPKKAQLMSSLAKGPIHSSECYTFGPEIGKGSCGKVYKATHILTGLQVAIKAIDKLRLKDERRRRKVMNEIKALHRCNGDRVVRLFEVFESKTELYLVLELMEGGDLYQYVKSHGPVEEPLAKGIFAQLVEAVKLVHSLSIAHRDIKLDNVLLSANLRDLKLCDFSICRIVLPGLKVNDFSGTPAYLAPEVLVNCEHDPLAADVWSLGVLLYAMLHAALPFLADDIKSLQRIVLAGEISISRSLSAEASDLILSLLELVPQKRPRLTQVLEHPWMKDARRASPGKALVSPSIISHMKTLGFPENSVLRSLESNELNQATTTYYLLLGSGSLEVRPLKSGMRVSYAVQ